MTLVQRDPDVDQIMPGFAAARPVLDLLTQPVLVMDLQTTIFYWNPASEALYGYTAEQAIGQAAATLIGAPTDPKDLEVALVCVTAGQPWTGEFQAECRGGERLNMLVTMTPVIGPAGPTALIATSMDITVATEDHRRLVAAMALVEQQSEELRHQALHDFLTGLPNRALVLDRAEQMLARARREQHPLAVLFVDLDNFKDINDSLGHAAGDQLLKAVAIRLTGALRSSDTVGRLGGDEFVVLAEGSSLDAGSAVVAERLLDVLREPFALDADSATLHTVTASIGIAEGDRPQAQELLRDADLALYQAKADGRNRYAIYTPDMHTAVRTRLGLEADLRSAVEERQFFLDYQPTFGLTDITTVGVEALLRWDHPTRGVIAPLEFIGTLETTGLILSVGRWILTEACRQGAEWHNAGLDLTVSVNVSARQLESEAFVSDVINALATSGLAPSALIIEITETTLMRDAETTVTRLQALKIAGVRIAIDDFGTGYSSLAYLQQFPVDILKIDRSFITALGDSTEAEALLHTLIQLGKRLGLQTVAEGIETRDQLHHVQQQDCDTGQGFLIAKPMTPDAITEFCRNRLGIATRHVRTTLAS